MGLPGMREPAHQAPVDPELLRAMRQADVSSGFEQLMISCANASVVFLVVVVLFFTLLSKMPERAPSMKPPVGAAAQGKQAAGRGKDGRYTAAEVAQHASERDLWIIVKGKVYDVTSYVEEHPGGDAILRNAGRDSTKGFHGPQHPTRVFDILDDFRIGTLVEETHKDK